MQCIAFVETDSMFDWKAVKEQASFYDPLKSAERLKQERVRCEPHQGTFAKTVGISQARQSLLENGDRELRGDYLARISVEGLDVGYILTGLRSGGSALHPDEGMLVQFFKSLTAPDRRALLRVAAAMGGQSLPTSDVALASEDALARMFEGILTGEDLSADPSDVARMLARHLPAALEQTQDLAPDPHQAASPSADTPPPPPARPRRASPRSPRT